jgi:electron transfer flavoprotein beta subunit
MNIVVCIKQVPDTETKIRLKEGSGGIQTDGVKWIINPYCEFAVEEALRIRERNGGQGTVTLVCMGPDRAVESIRTALAMGADKAIHLNDPLFEGSDNFGAAKILAKAIQTIPHDIILCGKQAIDDDAAQVPQILAELLNIPHVMVVEKMEIDVANKKVTTSRRIEGGAKEVLEVPLPAVFGADKGMNEPRYASLPGIMKAKSKEVKKITAADLGLKPEEIGAAAAKVKIQAYSLPPERQAGKKMEASDPVQAAQELAKWLREEAKVI